MSEVLLIDAFIRDSTEAYLQKHYSQALSYIEAAQRVFSRDTSSSFLSKSKKDYYGHLIYANLALIQSKLQMTASANANLLRATAYKTDFDLTETVLLTFPITTIQDLSRNDNVLGRIAQSILKKSDPPKKQQPLSRLQGFAAYAENISNESPQPGVFLERGTAFYQNNEFRNATSDYYIAASLSPLVSQIWKRVALSAIKSNQFEIVLKAIRHLQTLGCTYSRAEAELSYCTKNHMNTFELLEISKSLKEPCADCSLGRLKFVFGDVKGALKSVSVLSKQDNVDHMIIQSLLMLAMEKEKLPTQISCDVLYGLCLKYVLNGIYKSLSYSIRDVPGSLWIPPAFHKSWHSIFSCETPAFKFVYPDGFNFSMPDQDQIVTMLNIGFNIGKLLYSTSINCREKCSCGLAYLQLIQTLREKPSYPFLNAISDVVHWLRIVDPLAPLFYRFDMYLIYLKRSEFITELSDYYQRVLESFKFDLTSKTADALMRDKILKANSADQIYQILLSNCYAPLPNGASTFIIQQADHSVSFGIYLPYNEHTINNFLAKARPIWDKIVNMINSKRVVDDQCSDLLLYALEWLYEYEKCVPIMYYSAIIGIVIFASILSSYFEERIISSFPDPMIIQMEAILANDFNAFYQKMKTILDVKFSSAADLNESDINDDVDYYQKNNLNFYDTLNIFEQPEVVDFFPTYHHRLMAFLLITEKVPGALPYSRSDLRTKNIDHEVELDEQQKLAIKALIQKSEQNRAQNAPTDEEVQ